MASYTRPPRPAATDYFNRAEQIQLLHSIKAKAAKSTTATPQEATGDGNDGAADGEAMQTTPPLVDYKAHELSLREKLEKAKADREARAAKVETAADNFVDSIMIDSPVEATTVNGQGATSADPPPPPVNVNNIPTVAPVPVPPPATGLGTTRLQPPNVAWPSPYVLSVQQQQQAQQQAQRQSQVERQLQQQMQAQQQQFAAFPPTYYSQFNPYSNGVYPPYPPMPQFSPPTPGVPPPPPQPNQGPPTGLPPAQSPQNQFPMNMGNMSQSPDRAAPPPFNLFTPQSQNSMMPPRQGPPPFPGQQQHPTANFSGAPEGVNRSMSSDSIAKIPPGLTLATTSAPPPNPDQKGNAQGQGPRQPQSNAKAMKEESGNDAQRTGHPLPSPSSPQGQAAHRRNNSSGKRGRGGPPQKDRRPFPQTNQPPRPPPNREPPPRDAPIREPPPPESAMATRAVSPPSHISYRDRSRSPPRSSLGRHPSFEYGPPRPRIPEEGYRRDDWDPAHGGYRPGGSAPPRGRPPGPEGRRYSSPPPLPPLHRPGSPPRYPPPPPRREFDDPYYRAYPPREYYDEYRARARSPPHPRSRSPRYRSSPPPHAPYPRDYPPPRPYYDYPLPPRDPYGPPPPREMPYPPPSRSPTGYRDPRDYDDYFRRGLPGDYPPPPPRDYPPPPPREYEREYAPRGPPPPPEAYDVGYREFRNARERDEMMRGPPPPTGPLARGYSPPPPPSGPGDRGSFRGRGRGNNRRGGRY